ncbi:MAG: ABC transporter permease subunit [Rhizobacter sp.]|nr:ABC transporter permease subunit [Chlorobiales bacterium]
MLGKVLRHEWRVLRTDGATWILIVVFAAAMLYAAFGGRGFGDGQRKNLNVDAAQRSRVLDSLKAVAEKETAKLVSEKKPLEPPAWGVRHPYLANFQGAVRATLPPAPLAAFAAGQSEVQQQSYTIRLAYDSFSDDPELQSPMALLSGRFDLAFVMVYLFPLLILALGFNMLSLEKEEGTLALLLSQPVTLGEVVLGKIMMRGAVLFAATVVLTVGAYWVAGIEGGGTELLIWIAASLLYGAFWFALAALVSAYGKSSATNALILAGCWLGFVVIVPSLLGAAVSAAYPLPSRVEYISAVRGAGAAAEARNAKRMEKFYFDHPELAKDSAAKQEDFAIEFMLSQQDLMQSLKPVEARFKQQLAGQRESVNQFQFFSPAVMMQTALQTLAGTGAERHQRFTNQVEAFYGAWWNFFEPRIFRRAAFTEYDALPKFVYQDEPVSERLGRMSLSGAVLLLLGIGISGWAATRLARFAISE